MRTKALFIISLILFNVVSAAEPDWYYPLYNSTSTDPMTDLMKYMNEVTSDAWWNIMLLTLLIISTLGLMNRGYEPDKAFLASLGLTNILGTLFVIIGLTSIDILITCLLLTGAMAVYVYYTSRQGG